MLAQVRKKLLLSTVDKTLYCVEIRLERRDYGNFDEIFTFSCVNLTEGSYKEQRSILMVNRTHSGKRGQE